MQYRLFQGRPDAYRVTLLTPKEVLTTSPANSAEKIRIKSISLHSVSVPLIEPFRISNGSVAVKEAILIEVMTRGGVVGWGEASPMSGTFYSGDTPESVRSSLISSLIPTVVNSGEVDVAHFYEMLRTQPGDPFAKAGLEGALWDAHAKTLGVSLCNLLGSQTRPIPSGVAIGICDRVEDLLARVERYVGQGYQRVKIKIEPGWDLEPVTAIREQFASVPLTVDANAAYSISDAAMFRELDAYGLTMIEQPLAREAHAEAGELQKQLNTPLCADESAESMEALSSLIENSAARIINIKVQRVGGLSEAKLMLTAARSAGLECWVGTMPELGVASAHGLHLATMDGFSYPTDIEASTRWYIDDVISPTIEIDGSGYIHLPPGPGMGYSVLGDKVEKYSVETVKFEL